MTDQLQQVDRIAAPTTAEISDSGQLSQHVGKLHLQAAMANLVSTTAGPGSDQMANTTAIAPTGTWARFTATTEEGVKDFIPGVKHAFSENATGMLENAAISAAIGFAGKVILPETGPLGYIASIGMGTYFGVTSLVPVVHAYKTGIGTGDIRLAGQELGDAVGGAVANLPVAAGSYWAGARLGSSVMGMDAVAGFAAWKESKLAPINNGISNFFARPRPALSSNLKALDTSLPAETSAAENLAKPGKDGATAHQAATPTDQDLASLQQQLAIRLKRTLSDPGRNVVLPEAKADPLAGLLARIRGQKLSAISGRIDGAAAPPKAGFEVVLSASGAETTAHIGFLQALEDKNVPISSIIGASGGSIAATFYANGYSAAQMRTIFLSPEFRQPSMGTLADCMHITDPWNLWPYALDLKPWLQELVTKYGLKPQPNLRIVAADSVTHEPTVFQGTDYDLPTALAASTAATPAMGLKPVRYNGRTLVDGFYYHPIPAALAERPPAIVSKIGFTTKPPSEVLTPWDFFMHMKEMLSSAENIRNYPDPPGHIIAQTGLPDVAMTVFGSSTETLQKLIDHGYQAATARLEQPDAVAALASRASTGDAPSTNPAAVETQQPPAVGAAAK